MQRQDTMITLQEQISSFLDFVSKTLGNIGFLLEMETLLPFDQLLKAKLRYVDDLSPIKSMGVVVMRMEMEPAKYALGIEIALSCSNKADTQPTRFIAACKTIEELLEFVKSDAFAFETTNLINQLNIKKS